MQATIYEVYFSGQVTNWVSQIVANNGVDFPIHEARIETLGSGSRKRRDLTFFDRKRMPLLTGEVKLPWAADGHSPYVEEVVEDARQKAKRAGVRWFFTWNINELLLWSLDEVGALGDSRTVERYEIGNIQRREDLDNPKILATLRGNFELFVQLFARTLRGERYIGRRTPDIYFIHSLESFLERPIQLTRMELQGRYERPKEREKIESWMRDRQGWALGGDEDEILLRAARFTNFVVANRLIFYEALRKRFSALREFDVPEHVDSGERLFDHMRAYFDEAQHVTGDYETIFGIDANEAGHRIPFYEDLVIGSWRRLAEHVHRFDFSKLDYDVIGQIFEGLIGPEERHKYGQYYTRPELVDVINSFCIRDGDNQVMDPGCGGGTFLVRAYARKRHLSPRLSHVELLRRIYGADVSRFAAHLSTMNLAVRDLVDAKNYPRVVRSDFFELRSTNPIMSIPDGSGGSTDVIANGLDAVVGNPPYVRQEDIPPKKKKAYRSLVKREASLGAGGRSDLHVYFWGHAVSFLKRDGWLGFLTSSQWLDVEYGFPLQFFLLERFKIAAIIESRIEPWFVGARVQTVATLAQLEQDEERRNENIVRFVEVRKPLAEVLNSDGTSIGAIATADEFRDTILNTSADMTTDEYRIRCVRQGDLLEEGLRNGEILKGTRQYAGSKWGIPLRAPDLWSTLRKATAGRWKRLGELAEVRFGIKTGADWFFYVEDITARALEDISDPSLFKEHYGAPRAKVANGTVNILKNGKGELHPIEAEYLEPVVHSLMHIDEFEVTERHCDKLALMCAADPELLEGKYVGSYIQRGEELSVHTGSTVAARANENRSWYDLTNARRVPLLWAKSHQYRHCAASNPNTFLANCNLYTVDAEEPGLAAAVLNSTLVLFAKHLYGRPVGVEANLKTEIVDVNMMPVPDWMGATKKQAKRLHSAFNKLSKRRLIGVLSESRLRRQRLLAAGKVDDLERLSDATEFNQFDRQELDDAVLEILGFNNSEERWDLYTILTQQK